RDRRPKLHGTLLLRPLGHSTAELLDMYYDKEVIHLKEDGTTARDGDYDLISGQRATQNIRDPESGEILVKKGKKLNKANIKKMRSSGISEIPMEAEELIGKVAAEDVYDEDTGEVLLNCNEAITEGLLEALKGAGVKTLRILYIDDFNVGPFLRDTLIADKLTTSEDAIMEIYRRLRPGDPPTLETARNLFESLFFRADRYDLSTVGRLK